MKAKPVRVIVRMQVDFPSRSALRSYAKGMRVEGCADDVERAACVTATIVNSFSHEVEAHLITAEEVHD